MTESKKEEGHLIKVLSEVSQDPEGYIVKPNTEISKSIKERPMFLSKN